MKFKSMEVSVKAGPDDELEEGIFTAYASVFGNMDSYGDVVVKGAFEDTLREWESSGNTMPLLYSHRMDDPDYNIGSILEAKEEDRKSTRLNSSHVASSYAVFCLNKKSDDVVVALACAPVDERAV